MSVPRLYDNGRHLHLSTPSCHAQGRSPIRGSLWPERGLSGRLPTIGITHRTVSEFVDGLTPSRSSGAGSADFGVDPVPLAECRGQGPTLQPKGDRSTAACVETCTPWGLADGCLVEALAPGHTTLCRRPRVETRSEGKSQAFLCVSARLLFVYICCVRIR